MSVDQVRLLIPDTDPTNQIFTDPQIETFLLLSGDKVFLAAARALEVAATDEAMTYKIVRTDDLSVNGVTGAELLLSRARRLRDDQNQSDAAAEGSFFLTFPEPAMGRIWNPEGLPFPCL